MAQASACAGNLLPRGILPALAAFSRLLVLALACIGPGGGAKAEGTKPATVPHPGTATGADPVGRPFAETHARMTDSEFHDPFTDPGVIEDASRMDRSLSPFWWVNSGGCMIIRDGRAMTLQGDLPEDSRWRAKYAAESGDDTDGGVHPQNIFRLITRSRWRNLRQEAYFRIRRYHLSRDVHRGESNGLLLFSRYKDADNLYYAGVRVDGYAVIKKKIKGEYYTLVDKPVFTAAQPWDREKNPNLLPEGRWIGLRCEVYNTRDGNVRIRLFLDRERNGKWALVLEALDRGRNTGGGPFRGEEHAGIRTDFMDVELDDYQISDIGS
ncbi:MAG: hypothetical protein KA419_03030 [Acidobacteria bacterium]|nr:hypothetical protein [Acidobacteriota bacterium]